MAIDWDAEVLAPMMGAGVFGEEVQPMYQPQYGGLPFPVDGVFDNPFQADTLIAQDAIPEFQTVNPVLGVRLAQFPPGPGPVSGDTVYIASEDVLYVVNEVKPDGHGWAKLELSATE